MQRRSALASCRWQDACTIHSVLSALVVSTAGWTVEVEVWGTVGHLGQVAGWQFPCLTGALSRYFSHSRALHNTIAPHGMTYNIIGWVLLNNDDNHHNNNESFRHFISKWTTDKRLKTMKNERKKDVSCFGWVFVACFAWTSNKTQPKQDFKTILSHFSPFLTVYLLFSVVLWLDKGDFL